MFSWEISQLLSENNYNIDSETYLNICATSPQLDHISCGQLFEIWSQDGYHWEFTVYRKEK